MTVAEALFLKQPWLILPDSLQAMTSAAQSFFSKPIDLPQPVQSSLLGVEDGVGVVAMLGPMIRKPDLLSQILFNATDTEEITAAVREAASRPDIEAIFLDIDSPGGTVTGTPELAQAVADAGNQKPVYAFSSGLMCSAAYWVASQAQAVYVTPSARVGSIGVIQPIIDDSEAFKNAGLKVEVFAAGKFKGMGLPGVSLTDAQRECIQSNIAETAADFHSAVLSRGRKIPSEAMEGQDFSGKQAQRMNLAGVVRDRADALSRLRSYHVSFKAQAMRVDIASLAMKPIEDQLQEALARIQTLETDAHASANRLTETSTQTEAIRNQLTALIGERDRLTTDLLSSQKSVESVTARNKELEAMEQDIEKRVALRSAQVVSSTGTQVPAKISPAGDAAANATGTTTEQHIAHYNDLIKRKQPKAAAEFYEKNIQPLFNH
ncbi:MAG: S49 family peptidase [Chthoniobacteraceae bacterium]